MTTKQKLGKNHGWFLQEREEVKQASAQFEVEMEEKRKILMQEKTAFDTQMQAR